MVSRPFDEFLLRYKTIQTLLRRNAVAEESNLAERFGASQGAEGQHRHRERRSKRIWNNYSTCFRRPGLSINW
jgi:hypothetical protein